MSNSPTKKSPNAKLAKLKIHPAPFKPSRLSIPPSPFSPRVPITPPFYASRRIAVNNPQTTTYSSPPPPSPLQWLWQCHQCQRTYALGVTRRCLDDGHHFCAGTTTVKNWRKAVNPRKVRRHRACASEFDYQGWKAWGKWRRDETEVFSVFDADSSSSSSSSESESDSDVAIQKNKKDCWNRCDYPSECRWGKQFGVHSPARTEVLDIPACPPPPPAPPATNFDGILKGQNTGEGASRKNGKGDFWGALLASATRRKSVHQPSPLSLQPVPEEPETDKDGDVFMSQAPAVASPSLSSLSPITLKEMISKKSKKAKKTTCAEPKTPDPVLQVSPAAAAVGEFDFDFEEDGETGIALSPLKRVKSRDSGYFSHSGDEMVN